MMSHNQNEYVIIGKIGTVYGVKGWVKVYSFTEIVSNILNYQAWFIEKDGKWQSLPVEEVRPHGKGVVAKIAGFNTPEEARRLNGKLIAALRDEMPALKQDEYYWADLEGLTVINQHNKILGKIIYIMETGSNDVLVVKGIKEQAIPYLPSVVLKVDLVKKEMLVNWDEI